jgi:4-hydroxy-3-methylbut-2-enyl diphosphate reductase
VEKVWNRSQKLGETAHTIIIHGKYDHEETRATFSRSTQKAPSLIVKNLSEAQYLGAVISGEKTTAEFYTYFKGKYSEGFSPEIHLSKIGVVNQTTMLASETQEITDYLRGVLLEKHGETTIKNHMADTRDTLCYATNDNQSSTYALAETAPDIAIVVGGYNSSNTTHLVEILEHYAPTFFIKGSSEIISKNEIHSFNIHTHQMETRTFLPQESPIKIAITSGASCPDAVVDQVITSILHLLEESTSLEEVFSAQNQ